MRTKIDPNFKPAKDPALFKSEFPALDPFRTLAAFIAYHQEKGDTSANWDASFYGWCDYRQRQAVKEGVGEVPRDAMGFPLTPMTNKSTGEGRSGVNFLALVRKHMDTGKDFAEARLLAEAEITEGETA